MATTTYDSWTAQEKADMADMLMVVIPLMLDMLTAGNHGDSALSRWNSGLSTLVANLTPGEMIPNPTGLPGAGPVDPVNLANNIMAYVTTLAGMNSQAHIDNVVPVVGAQSVRR